MYHESRPGWSTGRVKSVCTVVKEYKDKSPIACWGQMTDLNKKKRVEL